jgi:hypothetical protein
MSNAPRKRLSLRWLTLAEIVGVAALAIAGLGYWDAHRERAQQDRERTQAASDRAAAARERQSERQAERMAGVLKLTFLMTGTPSDSGDRIRLASVHPEQVIQTQAIWFPAAVLADSVQTTGNPRIEARWLEAGLRKAAGKSLHGRVPVGVQTDFIEDGQTKTDRAVYLVGYSLHPRFLHGTQVQLEGLSLARRGVTEDLQFAADNLWAQR